MNLAFLQNEFVLALCWTLIHSLWQGLLLAAVTGAVLIATRKSNARKRYALLTAIFFLFILATGFTFLRELSLARPTGPIPFSPETITQQALTADAGFAGRLSPGTHTQTIWERITAYFNDHAAMVVMIWFIVFLARMVKLVADLVYVQRLRSYRITGISKDWEDKFSALLNALQISRPVKLLQSGIVKVPVTMGMLKPVILVPLGLLSQLPPEEVEAILLHELAHILRRDYFVNLLQSVAETIFFFNPALLWLSAMIREERENCCDDIAISVTNSKTGFINALIAFQEYRYAQPAYGLAFPGNKNQLLNRVKRILNNRNKTLSSMEKSILSLGIAVFVLFSFTAAKKVPNQPGMATIASHGVVPDMKPSLIANNNTTEIIPEENKASPASVSEMLPDTVVPKATEAEFKASDKKILADIATDRRDTLPRKFEHLSTAIHDDGKTRIMEMNATTKDGREIKLKKVDGQLKELSVNGKLIPEAEYGNYKTELDDMEQAYQQKLENGKRRREEALARIKRDREARGAAMERKMQAMKEDRERSLVRDQRGLEERQHLMEKKIEMQRQKLLRDKERLLKMDTSRLNELKQMKLRLREDTGWIRDVKKHYLERGRSDSLRQERLKLRKDTALHREYASRVQLHLKKQLDVQHKLELRERRFMSDSVRQLKLQRMRLDSLKIKMRPDGAAALKKLESLRAMNAEDAASVKVSADVMKNILTDLSAENINVNRQNGWFALDNRQFVVDGQPMTAAVHEKFRNKYLKQDGFGYYYGPVKVSGRGVFLDNKDVAVK